MKHTKIMNNLKKYTAPKAQTIEIGIISICANTGISICSDVADEDMGMMSKEATTWTFMEDE
jgi:hypothetical protein